MSGIDKNTVIILNGKLEDSSLTPKPITNNGVTISSEGKFGDCYNIDTDKIFEFDVNVSNEFTIEWFEYRTSKIGEQYIFSTNNSKASSKNIFMVGYTGTANDNVQFYYGNGSSWISNGTIGTIQLNQWVHRCLTYKDNSLKFYENGTVKNQFTISGLSLSTLYLGGSWNGTVSTNNIKIDEFRVSDICRYEGNFEVPSKPFSIDSPNINIISQDRAKINFNLSMYEDFTINSINVYVNDVIKQSFLSNYDNMIFNINEDDDYIIGDNVIRIVVNFDEGKEIQRQLSHKIYIDNNISLKNVMDEFEKISLLPVSSLNIITVNKLPSTVVNNQVCILSSNFTGTIYAGHIKREYMKNGDILLSLTANEGDRDLFITSSKTNIRLSIKNVRMIENENLVPVKSYIGKNGVWKPIESEQINVFNKGVFNKDVGGMDYFIVSNGNHIDNTYYTIGTDILLRQASQYRHEGANKLVTKNPINLAFYDYLHIDMEALLPYSLSSNESVSCSVKVLNRNKSVIATYSPSYVTGSSSVYVSRHTFKLDVRSISEDCYISIEGKLSTSSTRNSTVTVYSLILGGESLV